MKLHAIFALMIPLAGWAITFEEFAATYPDKDIHRTRAAYEAAQNPPVAPTPGEIAARAAAAAEAARMRPMLDAAAMLEHTAPLLADHPATNDVPPDGMFYRLNEGDVITLWYARQSDLLATQLSAHNAAGEEIVRTVNLRSGEDVSINLRKITAATKWQDMRDAKTTRTNRAARVGP